MLSLADLDFALPADRIAQHPLPRRDASRLLVVRRGARAVEDRRFAEVGHLLRAGDVLVLNDTRVIPARLDAVKPATGGRVEVLLLEEAGPNAWDVLVRPGRRVRAGTLLRFGRDPVYFDGEVIGEGDGGARRVRFCCAGNVADLLWDVGAPPLPPYIRRAAPDPADRERYQTVYARRPGAVAAPTAGLHFTREVLAGLEQHGVHVAYLTLHVGLGTFEPLTEQHLRGGRLHAERFVLPADTAARLNEARRTGHRIVAVGTTVVRVLESTCAEGAAEPFAAGEGATDLFIRPGHAFRAVDAMITNFHLPRSSLFALVCAFGGCALLHRAYAHAVAGRYRFYSYGDAMWIV